jgi:DNA ligase-associated metallophosphoesterase
MAQTQPEAAAERGRHWVNGTPVVADASGALYLPSRNCVVVADLHLEKGSAYAPGGQFLPPYDSAATLTRLAEVLARLRPRRVICLGDSFHDPDAGARLGDGERDRLRQLTGAHDWTWIAGNHDPDPPAELGGRVADSLTLGALVFRHEPTAAPAAGEIAGHFHPKACVKVRNRRLTRACFIGDGQRLILPAFGAYTGGLCVLHSEIARLFPRGFRVSLLGRDRVHDYPAAALLPQARR